MEIVLEMGVMFNTNLEQTKCEMLPIINDLHFGNCWGEEYDVVLQFTQSARYWNPLETNSADYILKDVKPMKKNLATFLSSLTRLKDFSLGICYIKSF